MLGLTAPKSKSLRLALEYTNRRPRSFAKSPARPTCGPAIRVTMTLASRPASALLTARASLIAPRGPRPPRYGSRSAMATPSTDRGIVGAANALIDNLTPRPAGAPGQKTARGSAPPARRKAALASQQLV